MIKYEKWDSTKLGFKKYKIYSVIVCYHPDISKLFQICHRLIHNGCKVILIDNSDQSYIGNCEEFQDCKLLINNENLGIAQAQNIGIKHALKNGADVLIFFDQDSIIGSNFLPTLIEPLDAGVPGVVSPVFYDNDKGFEFPSFRLTKYGTVEKIYSKGKIKPYFVDIIISSGSAATAETFKKSGLMDEDFFIDFVDTEWCLRCRGKKIPIRVVPKAIMKHSVGIRSVDLHFATVIIHSPTRCYYQIRNCFHLFRKNSIPILFALKETITVLIHKLLLLIIVKNKPAYIVPLISAVIQGIKGVTGKIKD